MERNAWFVLAALAVAVALVFASSPASAVEYYIGEETLNVGESAYAAGYSIKLVDISSNGVFRAAVQVADSNNNIIKQLTFDVPSAEITLIPEAAVYITPLEGFSGSYGQEAWIRLRIRTGPPLITPTPSSPTASPTVMAPCGSGAHGDGTYTFCVNTWIRTNSGHYVKLDSITVDNLQQGVVTSHFYIYDSSWRYLSNLDVRNGVGVSDPRTRVSILVNYVLGLDEYIGGSTQALKSVATVTSQSTPTVAPTTLPGLDCSRDYYGDSTFYVCVGRSVTASNGLRLTLAEIYLARSGNLASDWHAIFDVSDSSGDTSLQPSRIAVQEGRPNTVYHGGKWVNVNIMAISTGQTGLPQFITLSIKSSGSPTAMPSPTVAPAKCYSGDGTFKLTAGSCVLTHAGYVVRLGEILGFGITDSSGASSNSPTAFFEIYDSAMRYQYSNFRLSQFSSFLDPATGVTVSVDRIYGGEFAKEAYAIATVKSKAPSPTSHPLPTPIIATPEPIPPLPYDGIEYSLRFAEGWNLFSVPVSGHSDWIYPYEAEPAEGTETGMETAGTSIANAAGGSVPSFAGEPAAASPGYGGGSAGVGGCHAELDGSVTCSTSGSAGGSGMAAPVAATAIAEMPSQTAPAIMPFIAKPMPRRPVLDVATIVKSSCPEATLWQYDGGQRKYVNAGKLRVGERVRAGNGYWVRVKDGSCSVTVRGESPVSLQGKALSAGWNQIGGPYYAASFEDLKGSCTALSGPWAWNPYSRSYERAKTLEPGKGYFVKVAQSCTLSRVKWDDEEIPPLPEETKPEKALPAQQAHNAGGSGAGAGGNRVN
ncbi:MAG: hypothetical protein V1787_03655 [Candidatus Micrarchaeota archaeon]